MAIELVIAAQAVDLRRPARLGTGTGAAHARVREVVPFLAEGDTLLPDLEPVRELIGHGRFSPDGRAVGPTVDGSARVR